jgi:hypothetical protein
MYGWEMEVFEPMKPRRGRRFRMETRYVHQRSEGLTNRRNGGSFFQVGR